MPTLEELKDEIKRLACKRCGRNPGAIHAPECVWERYWESLERNDGFALIGVANEVCDTGYYHNWFVRFAVWLTGVNAMTGGLAAIVGLWVCHAAANPVRAWVMRIVFAVTTLVLAWFCFG